jgi:hypothetical protein
MLLSGKLPAVAGFEAVTSGLWVRSWLSSVDFVLARPVGVAYQGLWLRYRID